MVGDAAFAVDCVEGVECFFGVVEGGGGWWVDPAEVVAAGCAPCCEGEGGFGEVCGGDFGCDVCGCGGVGAFAVAADCGSGAESGGAACALFGAGLGCGYGDESAHAAGCVAAGFAGEAGVDHEVHAGDGE